VHYLDDPADVALVRDCGIALRRLRAAGFALVVVTNQPVIGKGLLDVATLARIHQRLFDLLAEEAVCIDALYYCPVAGAGGDRTRIEHPDRKPGPGMLLRAADELQLCLARSYMVGDMISDVLAGENAGCRASLLLQGVAGPEVTDISTRIPAFDHLGEAVDWILADTIAADALLALRGEE
jgi:D-glycero-D-manno-heptose 1,7-bisphosphate phosphatase